MSATGEAMASDDAAADRIEHALEHIAVLAARPRAARADGAAKGGTLDVSLAPRLDAVIARLRDALGG